MKLLFKKVFTRQYLLLFLLILIAKTVLAALPASFIDSPILYAAVPDSLTLDAGISADNSSIRAPISSVIMARIDPPFPVWLGGGEDPYWVTGSNWSTGAPPANNKSAAFIKAPVNFMPVIYSKVVLENLDFSLAKKSFTITNEGTLSIRNSIVNGSGHLQTIINHSKLEVSRDLGDNLQINNSGTLLLTESTISSSPTTKINNRGGTTIFSTFLGDSIFAGDITGGKLVKLSRDGDLRLTGDDSFDLKIASDGGYVIVGDDAGNGSFKGNVSLGFGHTGFVFNDTYNITYNGYISGFGQLIKRGEGQLTLTADNTYLGGTVIEYGSLRFGDGTSNTGSAGSGSYGIVNNGTLIYDHLNGQFLENSHISGAGGIVKNGNDTLIFTADNDYIGLTEVNAGTLQIGNNGSSGSLASDILIASNNSRVVFYRSDDSTYFGVISGFGGLEKRGSGRLYLSAVSTYEGDTLISDGELVFTDIGNFENSDIVLKNNASVRFANTDAAITYTGDISGMGRMVKAGDARLILSGTVSNAGGVDVNGGSLQIGDDGLASGQIVANIRLNGGDVIFNRSDKLIYEHVISGSGNVIKEGQGTLVLDGVNTYSGTTFVKSGALLIGGDEEHSDAQVIGDIVVMPGATVGGHGHFNRDVINDGVLAPAASIGVTSIHGNYTQSPYGSIIIELDSKGNSDLLSVDKKMKIAGNLRINTEAGFIPNFPYTFITAKTINGEFDNVDQDGRLIQRFLSAQVLIENDHALLMPDFNKSAMLAASTTPNRLAVTKNILSTGGTPAIQALIGKARNTNDFIRATDQLSGATYANQTLQLAQTAKWLDRQLSDQINKRDGFWILPYGSLSKLEENSMGLNTSMAGIELGMNKYSGKNIQWGVAVASSYFNSDATGSEIASDYGNLYQLGIYGDYHYHHWIIDTHLTAGTTNTVNASRNVGKNTASGSYIATVFSQQIKAGYEFLNNKNYFFPFAGLFMQQVNRNSFSETGDYGIALELEQDNYKSVESQIGVSIDIPLDYADWFTSIDWQHQFADTQATLNTRNGLHIGSVDMGNDLLEVSTGFKIAVSKKLSISFIYQGYFADNYIENGVQVQVNF